MKIVIFIQLIVIIFVTKHDLFGQNNFNVAIELERMNLLYQNLDNPVKIVVDGCDSTDITVEIDNGSISGDYGNYIIKPDSIGYAHLILKCREKEISNSVFRVRAIPKNVELILISDSKYNWILEKELISRKDLKNIELKLGSYNSDFDWDATILSFVVSVKIEDQVKSMKSESNKFSDEQIRLINEAKMGDYVYFEDIVTEGPNGQIRKIGIKRYKLFD